MMKKNYIQPEIEMVTIQPCELLAGSALLFDDEPADGGESLAPEIGLGDDDY